MRQKNQQKNSDTLLTSIPIEASQQQGATREPLPDDKRLSASNPARTEQVRESSTRKGTGPRTREGKLRSKYNARKHGISSKELVLKNESSAEFELLRKGLWEDYPPHGALDTEILNDLLVVRWNKRRARRAINAIFA
jgi:hypothetical protein